MTDEINVAYEGTSADLRGVSDAALFDHFAWDANFAAIAGATFGNEFTSVNQNMPTAPGTVSPQDIFNDVPPSAAYTNLTTPGSALLDTPDDSYEASPLFADNMTADPITHDSWFSLFPEEKPSSPQAPVMSRSSSSQVLVHPGGESRKRGSTTSASPMTASSRPSATAGVTKQRVEKVLAPIVVDGGDLVALKRARNTAAARKSRDKKVKEREEMESRISDLERQIEYWKALALAANPSLDDTAA